MSFNTCKCDNMINRALYLNQFMWGGLKFPLAGFLPEVV